MTRRSVEQPPEGLVLQGMSVTAGPRLLLGELSLQLPGGSTLVVGGPAASGKSTVLATIAGARPPATGRVLLDGRPVSSRPPGPVAAYVPQIVTVLPALTATENVALALLAQGVAPEAAWTSAGQHLEDLGLPVQIRHNQAGQLSGGQRQRVAFARATVGTPRLLVADDPTSELDPDTAQLVLQVIRRLAGQGCVVVLASTDPAAVADADQHLTLGARG